MRERWIGPSLAVWLSMAATPLSADGAELLVGLTGGSSRLAPTEYRSQPRHTMLRGDAFLLDAGPSPVLFFAGVSVGLPQENVSGWGTEYRASASYADLGIGLRWPTRGRYFFHGGWGLSALLDYDVDPQGQSVDMPFLGGVFQAGFGLDMQYGLTAQVSARTRLFDKTQVRNDFISDAKFGNAEILFGLGFWNGKHGGR